MIHLPPLPGYLESKGIDHAIGHAVADLHVLEEAGVDGILIENEYDRPSCQRRTGNNSGNDRHHPGRRTGK